MVVQLCVSSLMFIECQPMDVVQVTDNQPLHLDDSLQVISDNLLCKMLFHFLLMFRSQSVTVVVLLERQPDFHGFYWMSDSFA